MPNHSENILCKYFTNYSRKKIISIFENICSTVFPIFRCKKILGIFYTKKSQSSQNTNSIFFIRINYGRNSRKKILNKYTEVFL